MSAVMMGLLAAAGAGAADLTVGSKPFPENRLLAEMMAQLIEAKTDLSVDRRINLGGTMIVLSAIESGEIDLYPEYTGTGWAVMLGREDPVGEALQAYATVAREAARERGLIWLTPFGFENSYGIAISEARAEALGVRTLSALAKKSDRVQAGFSYEFMEREDGFPGLKETYGMAFSAVRAMEHGLSYDAINNGEIDLTDTYTTDGKLARYPLRVLEDDLNYFPPYDAAPVIRADTLAKYPEVGVALDLLAYRLDEGVMSDLNARIEVDEQAFEVVARDYLVSEGLIGPDAEAAPASLSDRTADDLPAFIAGRAGPTMALIGEHLLLTAAAVVLAIGVAVPLGIVVAQVRSLSAIILSAAGVLQTIPSLALLALMIPIPGLGLSARSAVAALFLYALLPILRNTATGLTEIDADLIEAGRGMGMTPGQILRRVQLPLAVPTIMAGVRTATVISVGVATLAAFIGAGGLGEPILTGLQLNDARLILSGAVPAAMLAVIIDALLALVERIVTPRGLG